MVACICMRFLRGFRIEDDREAASRRALVFDKCHIEVYRVAGMRREPSFSVSFLFFFSPSLVHPLFLREGSFVLVQFDAFVSDTVKLVVRDGELPRARIRVTSVFPSTSTTFRGDREETRPMTAHLLVAFFFSFFPPVLFCLSFSSTSLVHAILTYKRICNIHERTIFWRPKVTSRFFLIHQFSHAFANILITIFLLYLPLENIRTEQFIEQLIDVLKNRLWKIFRSTNNVKKMFWISFHSKETR